MFNLVIFLVNQKINNEVCALIIREFRRIFFTIDTINQKDFESKKQSQLYKTRLSPSALLSPEIREFGVVAPTVVSPYTFRPAAE